MEEIIIDLSFEAREESPDDCQCLICEEKIFLKAWRLWAKIGDSEAASTQLIFCDSCYDPQDWFE